MAVLLSRATGNLTSASTWGLVDSTSYSNSESGNTTVPTATGAGARSAGATTGAITIDAIAVKLAARSGATGTITAELWNNTGSAIVAGTSVTLNVADLPASSTTGLEGGWIVFKFAAPVTLAAATSYMVQVTTSSANQVVLWTNGTANNWSRALRTTTTQAPAAGDDLIVAGEHTGAGTGNNLVVTNDQTAATDYGSNTNSTVTPAVAVCKRGTLKWADTSAANPYLRLSGHLIVYSGGTLNIGTTGTPIPRDSVAVLEFDPAADGDMGLLGRNGSTVNIQGLSRTSGKSVWKTLLTADASASGGAPSTSTLTVADDTGWLSGDMVAVASTTRTAADCEAGNLNANAGTSSIVVKDMTVAAAGQALPLTSNRGLTVAHSGTSPTQAEIILVTRNVKVRSTSATLMAYVFFDNTATVDIDWAEFYYLGENATNKRGIEIATTASGSFSMQFSSIHDTEDGGFFVTGTSADNIVFSSNACWNCCTTISNAVLVIGNSTSGTNITVSDNIFMRTIASNNQLATFSDVGLTLTNNSFIGSNGDVFRIFEGAPLGTWSGNVFHSGGAIGFQAAGISGTMSGGKIWRSANVSMFNSQYMVDFTFDGIEFFGNSTSHFSFQSFFDVTIKNCTLSGDTTFSTTNGINVNGGAGRLVLDNNDLGTASGIKTAHTQDINFAAVSVSYIIGRNNKFASSTEVGTLSNLRGSSFINSQKHDQTGGNHVFWLPGGKGQTDATIYNVASPSLRLTPTSASVKLPSAPPDRGAQVPVASGSTATVTVYTRKSTSGDGAAYNGSQPRLIQRANPALGQNSDVVLDTHTAAAGSWEQLSGVTSTATDDGCWEFVVDVDGTAGWVNVDDWAAA